MNIDKIRLTPEYIKSKRPPDDGYLYYQGFGEAIADKATDKFARWFIENSIWGQVSYLDASGTIKEWTMRCISEDDFEVLEKLIDKEV